MRLSKNLIVAATLVAVLFSGLNVEAKTVSKKYKKQKTPVASLKITTVAYPQIEKLIDNENYVEADRQLNQKLQTNPNDVYARSLYIISQAKQSKFDVAQSQLNAYLPKNSKNANLYYAQGLINIRRQASSDMEYRGNAEELIKDAVDQFKTAIKYNPKHYQAYNALGVIALNTGNRGKAREFFNKALVINPNYATAIDNVGTLDFLQGDYDSAQKNFLKTINLNPNSSTAYFHLAQVYDKKSLYSKGLDAIDHSLRIKSNSSVAYNLKGEILKKQGNEAAAIQSFKKAISIKPENTKPYMNLATIYEKRFDNELAIANLKSALAVNPELNQAKLYIGDISLLKGDNKQALKYYSSLVGVNGYNADALKGVANAYYADAKNLVGQKDLTRDNDLEIAYKNVEKALKVDPVDMQLYLAKLKLAKLMNKEKESQETLDLIINSKARGLNDMLAKGDAYYAMNDYKKAKEVFEDSIVFAQGTEDYLFIAEILTYDRFYPSAKNILRKVLINEPTNEEALHNLDYIMSMESQSEQLYKDAKYLKGKNKVFAREYAERALAFNPTNYDAALLTAKLCEKQKHYPSAIKAYRTVAGLAEKPRQVKKYNKKADKLEKRYVKSSVKYMKHDDKEFKKCQNKLTPSL